jgi:hypothetical protein
MVFDMRNRKERSVDPLRTNKQKLNDIIRKIEGLESPRLQRRAAFVLSETRIDEIQRNINETLLNQDSNLKHLKELAAAASE